MFLSRKPYCREIGRLFLSNTFQFLLNFKELATIRNNAVYLPTKIIDNHKQLSNIINNQWQSLSIVKSIELCITPLYRSTKLLTTKTINLWKD